MKFQFLYNRHIVESLVELFVFNKEDHKKPEKYGNLQFFDLLNNEKEAFLKAYVFTRSFLREFPELKEGMMALSGESRWDDVVSPAICQTDLERILASSILACYVAENSNYETGKIVRKLLIREVVRKEKCREVNPKASLCLFTGDDENDFLDAVEILNDLLYSYWIYSKGNKEMVLFLQQYYKRLSVAMKRWPGLKDVCYSVIWQVKKIIKEERKRISSEGTLQKIKSGVFKEINKRLVHYPNLRRVVKNTLNLWR